MKKKLIVGFVVVIVVIFLISFLPFPQHIERTYYGVNTENGEQVDIALDMKYLRFLFLKDKISGTITVETETETFSYGERLDYTGQTSVLREEDPGHHFLGWYRNDTVDPGENENPVWEAYMVHISSDFDKILILHHASGDIEAEEDSRYIGSVEQSQLEDTKKYFSGYFE